MKSLGKPIAVGRTAEVYAWEEGRVLKLYYDWCPPEWIEREARTAQVVAQAGIPAPAAGEIVEIDGRRGILYERVDGASMMDSVSQNLSRMRAFAAMLANLHLEMHRAAAPGLPSQREGLQHAIQSAKDLPENLRRSALAALERLPEGDRLCHGDFHPGNVILAARGPVIIDWMTAVQGHPAADLARTRVILSRGSPPGGMLTRYLILLGRRLYYHSYLECYRQQAPEIVALSEAYMPVMAAARLNEGIANERASLLKLAGNLA